MTGKFLLSYIPRDKVRHEFVSVTPEGFRFRKHNMDSVGQLIKWFKVLRKYLLCSLDENILVYKPFVVSWSWIFMDPD